MSMKILWCHFGYFICDITVMSVLLKILLKIMLKTHKFLLIEEGIEKKDFFRNSHQPLPRLKILVISLLSTNLSASRSLIFKIGLLNARR